MAVIKKGEDFDGKTAKVCSCGKPPGRGLLIQCGTCQQWYHFKCVRMTSKEAEKIAVYKCDKHDASELADPTDPARKTPVWKGQIVSPGLGFFPAEAYFLSSPRALPLTSVRSLLPHHMHVQGRLERGRGVSYLKTLLEDPTRHMNHLLVVPQRGNATSETSFAELRKQCADKISVLIIDPAKLKDFYLVDISDAETEAAFAIPEELRAIALIAVVVPVRR